MVATESARFVLRVQIIGQSRDYYLAKPTGPVEIGSSGSLRLDALTADWRAALQLPNKLALALSQRASSTRRYVPVAVWLLEAGSKPWTATV